MRKNCRNEAERGTKKEKIFVADKAKGGNCCRARTEVKKTEMGRKK